MDNLRGAALMTLAMLGFAIEDMLIKMLASAMPVGQIIGLLGAGGAVVFAVLCRTRRVPLFDRAALSPPVVLRNLAELIGTMGFVTAIALIPISTASAILQASPLLVTLGAVLFLNEPVGWRRWLAILVGFLGVLMIIRPGLEGFDSRALFAVIGAVGLAARDVATRRVPSTMSSMQLSFLAFLMLIPAAALLLLIGGDRPTLPAPRDWGLIAAAIGLGVVAYYFIVAAMRVGEISFVTPFRYTRIVFALIVGVLVFDEAPDALTLIGAFIIVASGLYTLWREQRIRAVA